MFYNWVYTSLNMNRVVSRAVKLPDLSRGLSTPRVKSGLLHAGTAILSTGSSNSLTYRKEGKKDGLLSILWAGLLATLHISFRLTYDWQLRLLITLHSSLWFTLLARFQASLWILLLNSFKLPWANFQARSAYGVLP